MLAEVKATYSTKYTCPMAKVIDDIVLNGFADETTGDTDWHGHYSRVGRRIVMESDVGFVYYERFANEDVAKGIFAAIETDYDLWDSDEGEDDG